MTDTAKNYRDAMKVLRNLGWEARTNVASCCSGCAEPLPYESDRYNEVRDGDTPLVWNFKGQGSSVLDDLSQRLVVTWADDATAFTGKSRVDTVEPGILYMNHDNLTTERFYTLKGVMSEHGFSVVWDGNAHTSVQVTICLSMEE